MSLDPPGGSSRPEGRCGLSGSAAAGWFPLWTAVPYLSFCHDAFGVAGGVGGTGGTGVVPPSEADPRTLYAASDSCLAFNRLAMDGRHGPSAWHPMLTTVTAPKRVGTAYGVYSSQFGLPGVLLNAVAEATGANRMRIGFAACETIGLLTAAAIAAFLVALGRDFGHAAAAIAAVLVAWSPQLAYLVPSVYWATCLTFAPFSLA